MQPFICSPLLGGFVIAQRNRPGIVDITEDEYKELLHESPSEQDQTPDWLGGYLRELGYHGSLNRGTQDLLCVRQSTRHQFAKASYEIVSRCNYRCSHCYLGSERPKELRTADKILILQQIANSGALMLQLTGGEPLLSSDFVTIYLAAHELGMVVMISTNGSLLTDSRNTEVIATTPPYRVTISCYGATRQSYESLTGIAGSFQRFLAGLNWSASCKLRVRLNIILTKTNESELARMVELADERGFEHHTYRTIAPTLAGDASTQAAMVDYRDRSHKKSSTRCRAGKSFFHVDCQGNVSPCMIARSTALNLLNCESSVWDELPRLADEMLAPAKKCVNCLWKKTCQTCRPKLELHQKAGVLPTYICKKGGEESDVDCSQS